MEAKKSRVEIISRNTIKPSSPTPHAKRHLKLSLLDQTFSKIYGPMLFFYTTPSDRLITDTLQKSLSKTLVHFYPFAGQLRDSFTAIECNDHGAYFLQARINCKLSDFLRNPEPETINKFLPSSDPKTLNTATANNAITIVQLTVFLCGGIAIGVGVSHKIADAASICNFVKTWAAISTGKRDFSPPAFVGPDLFPPPVSPVKRIAAAQQVDVVPLRSRRFVFSASRLASLKAELISGTLIDFNPTTVEVLSSHLYKCLVAASGPSALLQMVNLRNRLTPSLAENTIGNISWLVIMPIVKNTDRPTKSELHEIMIATRRGFSEFFRDCKKNILEGEALLSMVLQFIGKEAELAKTGVDLYWFTSLSSFRLYEPDFGWGKPSWVSIPMFFDKHISMIDTKSGKDVEVWVTLEEKVMAKFETNAELLALASGDVTRNIRSHCRM